jgi:hypothetical protein
VTEADTVVGRQQLLRAIIAGTLLLFALGISDFLRAGTPSAMSLLGRPLIFAGLGRLAFEGRTWAPRLCGVWIALLAIVAGVNGIPSFAAHPLSSLLLFAFALMYGALAFRLIVSRHIKAFVIERHVIQTSRGSVA